jgi:hypothetical protein
MNLPTFEFHELANIFPMIEGTTFDALAADIASHGVREPVVLFEGKILDGRNRYRAAHQTGTRFATVDYTGPDARAFVMSMNLHRRHLTTEQRRELIRSELRTDPAQSDNGIAAKLKVSDKTVTVQRKVLEATSEIPKLTATKGKDGKTRAKPAKLDLRKLTKFERSLYDKKLAKTKRECEAERAAVEAARQPKQAAQPTPAEPSGPTSRIVLVLDDLEQAAKALSLSMELASVERLHKLLGFRIEKLRSMLADDSEDAV